MDTQRARRLLDEIEAALWDKHYGHGLDPAYAQAAGFRCEQLRKILAEADRRQELEGEGDPK